MGKLHVLILWVWNLGRVPFSWRGIAIPKSKEGSSMLAIVGQRLILEDHPEETQKCEYGLWRKGREDENPSLGNPF
jgi:hypothetical protein